MTPRLTAAIALRNMLGGERPRSPAVALMDGVIDQLRSEEPRGGVMEQTRYTLGRVVPSALAPPGAGKGGEHAD